jgi:hypothetical protein
MDMTAADWWWTGWNNCTRGYYAPPSGIGVFRSTAYRIGWIMRRVNRKN